MGSGKEDDFFASFEQVKKGEFQFNRTLLSPKSTF
jgi:hypothetical protein